MALLTRTRRAASRASVVEDAAADDEEEEGIGGAVVVVADEGAEEDDVAVACACACVCAMLGRRASSRRFMRDMTVSATVVASDWRWSAWPSRRKRERVEERHWLMGSSDVAVVDLHWSANPVRVLKEETVHKETGEEKKECVYIQ
jgi:hypothetical protein